MTDYEERMAAFDSWTPAPGRVKLITPRYIKGLPPKGPRIPLYAPTTPRPISELTERTESIAGTFSRLPTTSTGAIGKSWQHNREKQRPQRAEAGQSSARVCDVIHVRGYNRPSWLTTSGVSRKRRVIEGKGLPSFKDWRFITVTLDQSKFTDALSGYLAATDHMRRFLYACRQEGLWRNTAKWCWKLEFQENGWPHWHLLVEKRRWVDNAKIQELWGLGFSFTERVNEVGFCYNFKYAFKPALVSSENGDSDDFERCAPDWFLDYQASKTVTVNWTDEDGQEQSKRVSKPVTATRIRFWQTSRGFYTGRKKEAKPSKEQTSWTVPITAREALDKQHRTVQVIARRACGRYKQAACVTLDVPLEKFWNLVGFDTVNAGAVGLGCFSYVIPTHRLTTDQKTKWLIQPLLKANRLNLHHARRLQAKGENLRTC